MIPKLNTRCVIIFMASKFIFSNASFSYLILYFASYISSDINTVSPTNLKWFNLCPIIFKPLSSPRMILNIHSRGAVNNLGEIVSSFLVPQLNFSVFSHNF